MEKKPEKTQEPNYIKLNEIRYGSNHSLFIIYFGRNTPFNSPYITPAKFFGSKFVELHTHFRQIFRDTDARIFQFPLGLKRQLSRSIVTETKDDRT